ncbi:MAG TPA: DUF1963 domain-containing protein [Phenylobacterium sp.]
MPSFLTWLSPSGRTDRKQFGRGLACLFGIALVGHAALWGIAAASAPANLVSSLAVALYLGWVWAAVALLVRRLNDVGGSWRTLAKFTVIFGCAGWLLTLAVPQLVVAVVGLIVGGVLLWVLAKEKSDTPSRSPARRKAGSAKARATPTAVLSDVEASADAKRIWRAMKRARQSTLLLAPGGDAAKASKMGGEPDLPEEVTWPSGHAGPRPFLLQLALSDVRAAGGPDWLPESGALFAFGDELSDDSGLVHVLYAPRFGFSGRAPPDGLPAKRRHPERRVKFIKFVSIPSLSWMGEDVREIDVDDAELDALADVADEPFGGEPQHRIGGYPSEIQEDQLAITAEFASRGAVRDPNQPVPKEIDSAAKSWRLLFQIDSDPALNMRWCGRLYVFVREHDARAGDFSKTATVVQCD